VTDYKAALAACNRALNGNPGDRKALALRDNIVHTMELLGIK
jgi:hypothetical protein